MVVHNLSSVGSADLCNCEELRESTVSPSRQLEIRGIIGPAVRADFRRLYRANAKTPTCCPSDDNRTKVTNSVTSARSLWWHVGPYFWPADLTRTANPIIPRQFGSAPSWYLCNEAQASITSRARKDQRTGTQLSQMSEDRGHVGKIMNDITYNLAKSCIAVVEQLYTYHVHCSILSFKYVTRMLYTTVPFL